MSRTKVVAAPLLTGLVAMFTLAACGGGSSTPGTVPVGADVVVKAVEGVAWDAKSYSATTSDGTVTIYVENRSSIPHNFHVRDEAGKDLAKVVNLGSKGANGTITVDLAPGTYQFVCTIPGHESLMNSTLTVTAGAAPDTTAASDTTAAP